MKWFDAMLAFALTMVVFSTMVTVLLEILYRVVHAREKIFKLMLERLFDQVLWPLVRERLASMNVAEVRNSFVHALIHNSAAADIGAPIRGKWTRLARVDNSKLTVLEFAERLAGTEVGKAIAAGGEQRVTAIVNDLAQKYERFAHGSRAFLAERSLTLSIALSMVLAFALNVDAVVLYRSFIHDAKLTSAINERFSLVAQEMKAANASLEKARAAGDLDNEQNVEEIKQRLEQMQVQFADLKSIGLPIGYENFPGCSKPGAAGASADKPAGAGASANGDPAVAAVDIGNCALVPAEVRGKGAWAGIAHNVWNAFPQFLFWIACVLLGGLLIGLGAPFWFDLAQGLSKSLQVLKAVGGGREREKDEQAAAVAAGTSPPPRNPVEAFTTAIAALPAAELRRLKIG